MLLCALKDKRKYGSLSRLGRPGLKQTGFVEEIKKNSSEARDGLGRNEMSLEGIKI